MGREGKNWRGLEPGDDVSQLEMKLMLVSGIFKKLRIFVVVPDVLSEFSKIENLFFFRGSVRCQFKSLHMMKCQEISGKMYQAFARFDVIVLIT